MSNAQSITAHPGPHRDSALKGRWQSINWARSATLVGALAALGVLVLAPMLMLLYGSLRDAPPGLPGSFTLDNYAFLFSADFGLLAARSFVIGGGSTLVAVAVGTLLAISLVRCPLPFASKLDALVLVPSYLTPIVSAIAWIVLLSPEAGIINVVLRMNGLPTLSIYGYGGIIWVMGLYYAPVAYLYLRPALMAIDRSYEESARVFGASARTTLWRVVIPLARPALLAGVLVIFVNAIGDFGIPGVLGARDRIEVIPTALVRLVVRFPSDPNTATVLGIALAVVTVIGLSITNAILAGRDYTTVGGRGGSVVRSSSRLAGMLGLAFVLLYLFVALVLPITAMAVMSFKAFPTPRIFSTPFTLDNYRFIFTFPSIQRSMINSALLSVGAAAVAAVLATLLGYFSVKHKNPLTRLVDYIAMSTIAVPHTVLGLGLIWFWVSLPAGVYGTRWILLIAYIAAFFPYALRAAISAFMQVDNALEESGRVFGASWPRAMWRIVLPLIVPGLLSGATMVIYYSFRELTASLMLYTAGSEVMATALWEMFSEGRFVQLFALAMVNIVIVMTLVAFANMLARRSPTR